MTHKERRNAQKARILLTEVRNFLTSERNKAHGDEKRQKEYNINIDKILLLIDLTQEEK
jgi:hypothetical protein